MRWTLSRRRHRPAAPAAVHRGVRPPLAPPDRFVGGAVPVGAGRSDLPALSVPLLRLPDVAGTRPLQLAARPATPAPGPAEHRVAPRRITTEPDLLRSELPEELLPRAPREVPGPPDARGTSAPLPTAEVPIAPDVSTDDGGASPAPALPEPPEPPGQDLDGLIAMFDAEVMRGRLARGLPVDAPAEPEPSRTLMRPTLAQSRRRGVRAAVDVTGEQAGKDAEPTETMPPAGGSEELIVDVTKPASAGSFATPGVSPDPDLPSEQHPPEDSALQADPTAPRPREEASDDAPPAHEAPADEGEPEAGSAVVPAPGWTEASAPDLDEGAPDPLPEPGIGPTPDLEGVGPVPASDGARLRAHVEAVPTPVGPADPAAEAPDAVEPAGTTTRVEPTMTDETDIGTEPVAENLDLTGSSTDEGEPATSAEVFVETEAAHPGTGVATPAEPKPGAPAEQAPAGPDTASMRTDIGAGPSLSGPSLSGPSLSGPAATRSTPARSAADPEEVAPPSDLGSGLAPADEVAELEVTDDVPDPAPADDVPEPEVAGRVTAVTPAATPGQHFVRFRADAHPAPAPTRPPVGGSGPEASSRRGSPTRPERSDRGGGHPREAEPARSATAGVQSEGGGPDVAPGPDAVPAATIASFERLTGIDLGFVPVERGPEADRATGLQARGFTSRGIVHVPADAGPLDRADNEVVVAHELAHVAQQRAFGPVLPELEGAPDAWELQADAVERAFQGQDVEPREWEAAIGPLLDAPSLSWSPSDGFVSEVSAPVGGTVQRRSQVADEPAVPVTAPVSAGPLGNAGDEDAGVQRLRYPEHDPSDGLDELPVHGDDSIVGPPHLDVDSLVERVRSSIVVPRVNLNDPALLDGLAANLYDRMLRMLRSELIADRERAGVLTEFH